LRRSDKWHVEGWPAIALAVVLSPLLIIWALALKFLPFKKTADRTPGEVAGFIKDFLEGTGGEWDWDDFTSIPITNGRLDEIRQEACAVDLPLDENGKRRLETLMRRARALRPLAEVSKGRRREGD
jgi:hypothetical protein